jgi:hypothetical protein
LNAFSEQLREWQAFYSTVALASVTLAGLLFVSLSLHPGTGRARSESSLWRLARSSFGDFLYVLMLGLVFLVPHQAQMGLAIALLALGLSRGYGLARQALQSLKTRPRAQRVAQSLREIALPGLASVILVVVAVEVQVGNMVAIYGLVIVVAALLASASWTAWLILVERDTRLQ